MSHVIHCIYNHLFLAKPHKGIDGLDFTSHATFHMQSALSLITESAKCVAQDWRFLIQVLLQISGIKQISVTWEHHYYTEGSSAQKVFFDGRELRQWDISAFMNAFLLLTSIKSVSRKEITNDHNIGKRFQLQLCKRAIQCSSHSKHSLNLNLKAKFGGKINQRL